MGPPSKPAVRPGRQGAGKAGGPILARGGEKGGKADLYAGGRAVKPPGQVDGQALARRQRLQPVLPLETGAVPNQGGGQGQAALKRLDQTAGGEAGL